MEILNDGFDLIERSQCQALLNREFGDISRTSVLSGRVLNKCVDRWIGHVVVVSSSRQWSVQC